MSDLNTPSNSKKKADSDGRLQKLFEDIFEKISSIFYSRVRFYFFGGTIGEFQLKYDANLTVSDFQQTPQYAEFRKNFTVKSLTVKPPVDTTTPFSECVLLKGTFGVRSNDNKALEALKTHTEALTAAITSGNIVEARRLVELKDLCENPPTDKAIATFLKPELIKMLKTLQLDESGKVDDLKDRLSQFFHPTDTPTITTEAPPATTTPPVTTEDLAKSIPF
tara:strand:- start:1225 stop:1890 length:666 start_codon:yes stop_codon:yes gene_type:complete